MLVEKGFLDIRELEKKSIFNEFDEGRRK